MNFYVPYLHLTCAPCVPGRAEGGRCQKGTSETAQVKHLLVNQALPSPEAELVTRCSMSQEGEPAEFLREICTIKDPKIMVHPAVVMVSDTL